MDKIYFNLKTAKTHTQKILPHNNKSSLRILTAAAIRYLMSRKSITFCNQNHQPKPDYLYGTATLTKCQKPMSNF